eukprot:1159204-Pelagomonas_calceolata.AAC.2
MIILAHAHVFKLLLENHRQESKQSKGEHRRNSSCTELSGLPFPTEHLTFKPCMHRPVKEEACEVVLICSC